MPGVSNGKAALDVESQSKILAVLPAGGFPRFFAGIAEFNSNLGKWDSALVAFAVNCSELCQRRHIQFVEETLPPGVQRLIRLAQAVPEKSEARREKDRVSWLHQVGDTVLGVGSAALEATTFLGDVVLA